MPPPSVVILGAGLGGLTLGRCLRQRGVASVIYEQNSREKFAERHTYSMSLQRWAYKPLLNVVDVDENTFRGRVGAGDPSDTVGVSKDEGSPPRPFSAYRNKLEAFLQEGQIIRYKHEISSTVVSDSSGNVRVSFNNGRQLQPPLVVDASGVHSPIRRSLLPNIDSKVHPFVVYRGKRLIEPNIFSSMYAPSFENNNTIVHRPSSPGEPRLEISVNDYQSDGKVSISYVYSRSAKDEQRSPDTLFNPKRDTSAATKIPEAFYQEVARFTDTHKSSLSNAFNDCFDVQKLKTDQVLHWLMRTVTVPREDLKRLLHRGVVMIGDSAHATPILGGQGGNLAILDAVKLADILASKLGLNMWRGGPAMQQASNINHVQWQHYYKAVGLCKPKLADMYETQWSYWNKAVMRSERKLINMHRPHEGLSSQIDAPAQAPEGLQRQVKELDAGESVADTPPIRRIVVQSGAVKHLQGRGSVLKVIGRSRVGREVARKLHEARQMLK